MNSKTRITIYAAAGIAMLIVGCQSNPSGSTKRVDCPQPRFTGKAPEPMYSKTNPLAKTEANLAAGRRLYQQESKPVACSQCHGKRGDGKGSMSRMFDPPPRNFTCAETVRGIPDGQLFWIIRNGSPGTSMPAFDSLGDEKIWQIVLYIRGLSNGRS